MYRNIVVAYDGSDEARDALALAGVLRDREGVVTAVCAPSDRPAASWNGHSRGSAKARDTAPWLRTQRLGAGGGA